MQLNYIAILVAAVVQFMVAAVWYTPVFGKLWGKIHGFDVLPKEVQDKMMKGMGKILSLQFLMTLITTAVLALFAASLPADWNVYGEAGFFWLGFVMPSQVGAVIFGGDKKEYMATKIMISSGGSLIFLEVTAAVLHLMK